MNKYSRVIGALLLVFSMTFTSACAQMPKSGEVKIGPNVESGLETDYLYYSPSGPTEKATQEEILLGFINAGTGPQNDYEVARSYLTKSFGAEWDPNQEVLIQDGKPTITLTDDDTATVVVPIAAKINEVGQYETLPQGSTRSIQVAFANESGKWRIGSAPNLTMVIRPVFDVVFNAYAIYFFDNQQKHLVPDVRWFPSRASTSTRLVNALLSGPSSWLEPAVRNSIPSGTRLTLSSVTVADGIASVDLSSAALRATSLNKKLLQVQIRETLLQLSSVYSVRVTIERGVLEEPAWANSNNQVQVALPVALLPDGLVRLGAAQTSKIENATTFVQQVNATSFGLNADEKVFALSGPSGIYLAKLNRPTEAPLVLATGSDYLPPVVDADGYTWAVPRSGKKPILVYDDAGRLQSFASGWLLGQDRLSFSISAEGSRVLAVSGSKASSQVRVSAIIRDDSGRPTGVGMPTKPTAKTTAYAGTWLDSIQIGLLERQVSNNDQPVVLMVGGDSQNLPSFANAAEIVGSGQATSIFILDSLNALYQFRGSGWVKVREDVQALRFPGN
jgi:hypothetical protein